MEKLIATLAKLGELARAGQDAESIASALDMELAAVHTCLSSPGIRASLRLNEGVDGRASG